MPSCRQMLVLFRQWERLLRYVPEGNPPVRWIAEHTEFPYHLVSFVRDRRNECAHGVLPRADRLRRAVAVAGVLLMLIDRLADQGVPVPSRIVERRGATVVVGCGSCGAENWLPATALGGEEPPNCSSCARMLIVRDRGRRGHE